MYIYIHVNLLKFYDIQYIDYEIVYMKGNIAYTESLDHMYYNLM